MPLHHRPYGSGKGLSHLWQRTAASQGNSPSSTNCPLATAVVNFPLATAGVNSGFLPHTGYSGSFASPEVHMDESRINTAALMLGRLWRTKERDWGPGLGRTGLQCTSGYVGLKSCPCYACSHTT